MESNQAQRIENLEKEIIYLKRNSALLQCVPNKFQVDLDKKEIIILDLNNQLIEIKKKIELDAEIQSLSNSNDKYNEIIMALYDENNKLQSIYIK